MPCQWQLFNFDHDHTWKARERYDEMQTLEAGECDGRVRVERATCSTQGTRADNERAEVTPSGRADVGHGFCLHNRL
jgi:hypothetical protein